LAVESGVKDEKPLALRTWSLNGGVIRIQLTRLADFADGDAIHGAIHAFTKALAGSRAPSDAALVEALEEIESLLPTLEPIANQICPPGCLPTIGQQSKIDALVKPCAVAARALAAAKGQQP
jgi:hypothetical protein